MVKERVMNRYIDLQELGAELHIYGEIDDPAMRDINPSLEFDGDKLKIAIRHCNFKVEPRGAWSFRDGSAYSKTDVLYGDLDPESLAITNLKKLKIDPKAPKITLIAGLEDVRLFKRKDGMHAIGFESDRLSRSLHNASATLAEYLIDTKSCTLKYIRTLEKPSDKVVEKNWQPTNIESKEFDFTYSPTQVWKDGKVIGMDYNGNVHGGSQLIKQKDGTYLSLVHEKLLERTLNKPRVYDKYLYITYLAKHASDGRIIQLSKPFRFGTLENIEFASGMVEYKDSFLITLGIRDCKFAVCRISKNKLMSLFE